MERGNWSEISSDSDIWKSLGIGSVCFLLALPIPIAMGALHEDLTQESQRIKDKEKPGKFFGFDNPVGSLGKGLVPCVILFLAMMLYCLPTVVLLLSSFQIFGWFKSEHGIPYFSMLVTGLFGLLALGIQFLCTILLPISLAQYARGTSLRTAIDPMANFGNAMTMGATFWIKASGYWASLLASMLLFVKGPPAWLYFPVQFLICGAGFASLIVSARYALGLLQTKL